VVPPSELASATATVAVAIVVAAAVAAAVEHYWQWEPMVPAVPVEEGDSSWDFR